MSGKTRPQLDKGAQALFDKLRLAGDELRKKSDRKDYNHKIIKLLGDHLAEIVANESQQSNATLEALHRLVRILHAKRKKKISRKLALRRVRSWSDFFKADSGHWKLKHTLHAIEFCYVLQGELTYAPPTNKEP